MECDILGDGRLDLDDAALAALDYVVASVHGGFAQDEATMTARIIRAVEHPRVTMLGHLSGRLLLRREGYRVDVGKVIDAAIAQGVVIELNANPWRLDLDWRHWRKAAERGLELRSWWLGEMLASQAQLRELLGPPSWTWQVQFHDQTVWSYRYDNPFCQVFHVGLTPAGIVEDSAHGLDPACDHDNRP